MSVLNLAFYQFVEVKDPLGLRDLLREYCSKNYAPGEFAANLIIGSEGLNGMVSGLEECCRNFQAFLGSFAEFSTMPYKESRSASIALPRVVIRVRGEIIPIGMPEVKPHVSTAAHLPPAQLKQWLDERKDLILVDTRNDYEADCGTFEGAVTFPIRHFRDFPKFLEELPPEAKDKTVVMFCTGGIRCEKATAVAESAGFKDVYQLEGGILNYFEQCGGAHYNGDCFVFDRRVAVDSELRELSAERLKLLPLEKDERAAAELAHRLNKGN